MFVMIMETNKLKELLETIVVPVVAEGLLDNVVSIINSVTLLKSFKAHWRDFFQTFHFLTN